MQIQIQIQQRDTDAYDLGSQTVDFGPRISDRGPRTTLSVIQFELFSLSPFQTFTVSVSHCESPSFSFSLSQCLSLPGPQPLRLSAPERIHEIDVASCWKPTKLIRCEHYPLQHRGPPGTPHIHSQGAAEEYHIDPSRRY